MYLHSKGTGAEMEFHVDIEAVPGDLLILSISKKAVPNRVMSYWRLTKVDRLPPLEIGIDCEEACIADITIFLESSSFLRLESPDVKIINGSLLVDTSVFNKAYDFIDINKGYTVSIAGNKLVCLFQVCDAIKQGYQTDRLEVYLNSNRDIIGFAICDLTAEELNVIHSIS